MSFPEGLRYTKTHEWAKLEGNRVTVGITDYAQKEISDVVFVEVPKLNQTLEQGKPAAVVESVKAAFDIYAPVSGKVIKVNETLEGDPGIVNEAPYDKGYFFEVEVSDASEWEKLMSASDYEQSLKSSAH